MISIPINGGKTSNELRSQHLNPTQHWSCWRPWRCPIQSRGPKRLTCLDLPRDLGHRRLSCLSLLRDPSEQDPRKSTCLALPRDLVPGRLSCLNMLRDLPVQGVPGGQPALSCLEIWSSKGCHASTLSGIHHSRVPGCRHFSTCPGTQFLGGRPASTCLGIQSPGGCRASACLGICTLTQGCLALRLLQD